MNQISKFLVVFLALGISLGTVSAGEFPNEDTTFSTQDPRDSTFDDSGNLIIGDNGGITRYDTSGTGTTNNVISTYEGTKQIAFDQYQTNDIYVTGKIVDNANYDFGYVDQLARINNDTGDVEWVIGRDNSGDIALDTNGNIYVGGFEEVYKVDSSGNILWDKNNSEFTFDFSPASIEVDQSTGNAITPTYNNDIVVLDSSGSLVQRISKTSRVGGLAASDGYVYTGYENGTMEKIDMSDGTVMWSVDYGGIFQEVILDADRNVFADYSDDVDDLTVKFYENGTVADTKDGDERVTSISISPVFDSDKQYLSMSYQQNSNFDPYTKIFTETVSSTGSQDGGGTQSPTETIDNYIPGQTADFSLSVSNQSYPDQKYDDGDFTEFHYKDVVMKGNFSDNDSVQIIDESSWTQLDFPNSNGSEQFNISQTVDFNVQRYEDNDYSAVVSLVRTDGVYDFDTNSWNKTQEEVDRASYSWTVTAADDPVGPLTAFANFFSSILESLIDALDTDFAENPIGTPSVDNPPTGPSQ